MNDELVPDDSDFDSERDVCDRGTSVEGNLQPIMREEYHDFEDQESGAQES